MNMRKHILFLFSFLLISITLPAQCSVTLGADTSLCDTLLKLTPELSFEFFADSLRITYDADSGVSGLSGSPKVYIHAGAEVTPGAPWAYTIGNWGMDDSIGQMTNVGGNIWEITLEPYTYFGVPEDSTFVGIWMVFRNADGSLTGKDDTDNDIFLDLTLPAPTSAFGELWENGSRMRGNPSLGQQVIQRSASR